LVGIRLATFNCQNLFARFKFNKNIDAQKAIKDGWLANQANFNIFNEEEKAITSEAIKATKANVLALQEVESNLTLKEFRNKFLGGRRKYPEYIVIDGNDPRFIDVGVLSTFPIGNIRTHIHEIDSSSNRELFSRDCLECDILIPSNSKIKKLTLFVNHFKSMFEISDPCNGRKKTHKKRLAQANRVKDIVLERYPNGDGDFAILGDFNDFIDSDSSISSLVKWKKVVNVTERLPIEEQWTEYWQGNKKCGLGETFHQLDYILLSKSLAEQNADAIPKIIRNGLPKKASRYHGPWFEGVGMTNPKASDHCPIVIDLAL
jgi:predicted extracellular nuclease